MDTDVNTNDLLIKCGDSTSRGRGIDVGVGGSKHFILGSELATPDQLGDDALDAEFADDLQSRAEMAPAMPFLHPEKAMAPADVTESLDTDSSWLETGAVEEARLLKLIGWFMTTPTGIIESRLKWHRQTISRTRCQLREHCSELVAQAVAAETAKNIAEAMAQQSALAKLRAGSGL